MSIIRHPALRLLVALAAFAALAFATLAAAKTPTTDESVLDWLTEMEAFYDANPELKETRGSGWKPYNRVKWYTEQRLGADGQLPPARALWDAVAETRLRAELREQPARTSWFSIGPMNYSGRILDIEFDPTNPDIVYVASASGGLWKSVDNGLHYSTTTDMLPSISIGAVCVLPWNPSIVLIGTGEGEGTGQWGIGMLKSADAGQTWGTTSMTYVVTNSHGFMAIEANPITHTILAASRNGIWRSTDDGDNWTLIADGRWYDVKWKPGDPNRVYAVKGANPLDNGVKVSTDDGLTFADAGTGQPDEVVVGKSEIAVCASDPSVLYAHFTNKSNSSTIGIYRSGDDGATWALQNGSLNIAGSQGWYNLSLIADPDNSNRIVSGGIRIYDSWDGGMNFSETGGGPPLGNDTAVHSDHHVLAYEPGSPDVVWAGTDGGIWRSADDGQTWEARSAGLVTYQFYDIAVSQSDPIFMVGGTQDNGIPGKTGPTSWFPSTLQADGMVCNIHPTNASIVWGESQFGNHVKSYNGGVNWNGAMGGITGAGAWVAPIDLDMNNPTRLFTATSAGIFRSTNGGTFWVNVLTGVNPNWLHVSPVTSDVVWMLYYSVAKVSTDGGDTWNSTAGWGYNPGLGTKILGHPTNPDAAFVTFGGYQTGYWRVLYTDDLGASWQDVSGDLLTVPTTAIAVDPDAPNNWFVGTDTGVWHSVNGGVNWVPYETGLPSVAVDDLEIQRSARKLVAGTYGRGLWEINLPALTNVGGPLSASNMRLMLDAPYPNPVEGRTTLRFAARDLASAELGIYDIRGRLIERVTSVRGDGIVRTMDWTPAESLASGAYFAVLTAGDERVTQKVIVRR